MSYNTQLTRIVLSLCLNWGVFESGPLLWLPPFLSQVESSRLQRVDIILVETKAWDMPDMDFEATDLGSKEFWESMDEALSALYQRIPGLVVSILKRPDLCTLDTPMCGASFQAAIFACLPALAQAAGSNLRADIQPTVCYEKPTLLQLYGEFADLDSALRNKRPDQMRQTRINVMPAICHYRMRVPYTFVTGALPSVTICPRPRTFSIKCCIQICATVLEPVIAVFLSENRPVDLI